MANIVRQNGKYKVYSNQKIIFTIMQHIDDANGVWRVIFGDTTKGKVAHRAKTLKACKAWAIENEEAGQPVASSERKQYVPSQNLQAKRGQLMQLMAAIEEQTGKMFQETHPDLEQQIWESVDANKNLLFLVNQLAKELDSLQAGQ